MITVVMGKRAHYNSLEMSARKKVQCKLQDGDDVIDHIKAPSLRKSSLRSSLASKSPTTRTRNKKRVSIADNISVTLNNSDEEFDQNDVEISSDNEVFKPSESLHNKEIISGKDIFSFQSPMSSARLRQTAMASAEAASPKSILKKPTQDDKKQLDRTPKGKRRVKMESQLRKTPQRLKARARRDSTESSSSSEVSDEDSDDADDQKVSENNNKVANSANIPDLQTQSIRESAEHYFEMSQQKSVTSDNTLDRLKTPRLDQMTVQEKLKSFEPPYSKERKKLNAQHREKFPKWFFFMENGFNILLHGLGSKKKLLDDFSSEYLKEFCHVVIYGFFPSLTIKSILNGITEEALGIEESFTSPHRQVEFIKDHITRNNMDFFLVIHNIDGVMLRNEKSQQILSQIAEIKGVHIVASIDHINAPLLWDHKKLSNFNWLWYDVTNFESYGMETSYENSLLVSQDGALALSSLSHVMKSLTPNARSIFIMVARYQLDNNDEAHFKGFAFNDLYHRCREAFLVNSDSTLQTQLTEFRDHKLIKTKARDGVDYLTIPLDNATLQEFLDVQTES